MDGLPRPHLIYQPYSREILSVFGLVDIIIRFRGGHMLNTCQLHVYHMLSTCSTQGNHEAGHMRQSTAMHSQCSVRHSTMRHLLTDLFLYISLLTDHLLCITHLAYYWLTNQPFHVVYN